MTRPATLGGRQSLAYLCWELSGHDYLLAIWWAVQALAMLEERESRELLEAELVD